MSKISLNLLCRLLKEVHRACYVKLSGATVNSSQNIKEVLCNFILAYLCQTLTGNGI